MAGAKALLQSIARRKAPNPQQLQAFRKKCSAWYVLFMGTCIAWVAPMHVCCECTLLHLSLHALLADKDTKAYRSQQAAAEYTSTT